jgi:hypothetical protein
VSIPLTFDWVTLAWLRLRFALWWQKRCGPRAALWTRRWALLLFGLLSGCVPITRLEEAQSAAEVEQAARRSAELQLEQLQAERQELIAQLERKDVALEQRAEALAQAELDKSTQGKERADAEGIVEQLRGELSRVGGYLQASHTDRQQLEETLRSEAARSQALVRLSRDLTLLLAEQLTVGEYELDAVGHHAVLRVGRDELVAEDGSLRPAVESLAKAVTRVLSLYPASKLRVEDAKAYAESGTAARLTRALGVAQERLEPVMPPSEEPVADSPAFGLWFSVP